MQLWVIYAHNCTIVCRWIHPCAVDGTVSVRNAAHRGRNAALAVRVRPTQRPLPPRSPPPTRSAPPRRPPAAQPPRRAAAPPPPRSLAADAENTLLIHLYLRVAMTIWTCWTLKAGCRLSGARVEDGGESAHEASARDRGPGDPL